MTSELIYLDYNSTTPIDQRVLETMMPFLNHEYGNAASSDHVLGWNAAEAVEEARFHVAELIGARPSEITFTSGATESINLALKGLALASSTPRRQIITSRAEHEVVLSVCRQLVKQIGTEAEYLRVDSSARINSGELETALKRHRNAVVTIMAANNEIGAVNPIAELAAIASSAGALFFTDATQAVGKVPIDVQEMAIDILAFSSHKVYGPKGVGAIFIRSRQPKIELEPLIVGGAQERGIRAGTSNVPGIVGFGEACRLAKLELPTETDRIRTMRDAFEEHLVGTVPGLRVNTAVGPRLPNTINVAFPGIEARALLRDLGCLAASTKSACSSADSRPSHVLTAIGLTDDQAYASVRFSLGRFTTQDELAVAADRLAESVRRRWP